MNKSLETSSKTIEGRQVIVIPIEPGLISLKGLSPKRLRFESEYGLERGSTANSFLFTPGLDSNQKHHAAVLIHPPGGAYAEVFIPTLRQSLPTNTTSLKVIVGHVNPNRVALLKELHNVYPDLELISSNPGAKLLKELWCQHKDLTADSSIAREAGEKLPSIQIIRKEHKLSTSCDHTLLLLPTPTPRWPGGLIAFEETLGLLMSDKLFAAHLCTPQWAEVNRASTEEERRHFYDCLMAPMANQVNAVVERLEDLDIQTIAPGHGPAIETSWRSLLNDYQRWGEGQQNAILKVVMIYASAYGNTASIADALAQGVNRTKVQIKSLNCEFAPAKELVNAIQQADGYLIGSPTLGGHAPTPIVAALGTLLAEGDREKPVGVFGSFGWSGEAIDLLENKLRDGGFHFGFHPIKVKFSPNPSMIKTIEETGTHFARELLQKHHKQQRRTSGGLKESRSDSRMLALGRIVGSLSVLTAKKKVGDNSLTGAMVASWVSQASFSPPGITIAVAKDRAVEALLHIDDYFALNLLAEGKEKKIMRQFLQPFPPGADRLKGLMLNFGPNDQPLLEGTLAWIEGSIKQRMECGDHWLIYAEIISGQLIDNKSLTAVHHRRTGTTY